MALLRGQKLKNCAQCGKLFSPMRGERLCRDCLLKEQEFDMQVIQYVRDNPGVSMREVMEETGASDKRIKRMIQEGAFTNLDFGDDFFYPCSGCGRPIRNGAYCSDCLRRLRKETKRASEIMQIRVRENKQMSTIERLDALAEREFERDNRVLKRHFSKSMYGDIADSRRGG